MRITIQDKTSLDSFVQRVSPQTNISASRLKTAIAKAFGFSHITAFEAALAANASACKPDAAPALSEDASRVLMELSFWLEDNDAMALDITFGESGPSCADVDGAVCQLLRQSSATALELGELERQHIEAFTDWLQENMGRAVSFDNEAKVTPEIAHAVLVDVLKKIPSSTSVARVPTPDEIEQECLAHYGLDSVDEFETEHYEQAEDALLSCADTLIATPSLCKALAVLEQSGLSEVAETLRALQTTVLRRNCLSDLL